MKKIIFSSLFFFAAFAANAQLFVEGVPIDSIHHGEYLIIETIEIGSIDFKVELEKEIKKSGFITSANDYLTDKKGKNKHFDTLTGGLNFFFENGWELAFVLPSSMTVTETKLSPHGTRLLLKRRR